MLDRQKSNINVKRNYSRDPYIKKEDADNDLKRNEK